MARASEAPIVQMIRKIVENQRAREMADAELLERFLREHDEGAFRALLHRHGPMVLGVCRRVLANAADAEDAFQATFLALAENARSIRKSTSLKSWLYGVAYRTALKLRVQQANRKKLEGQAPSRELSDSTEEMN